MRGRAQTIRMRLRSTGGARFALLAAVVLLALGGCGSGSTGEEAAAPKPKPKLLPGQISLHETVQDCVTEVGVQLAIEPSNIAFFKRAREAHDVVEIGSKSESKNDVVVHLLASRSGGSRAWMLWYSQPQGEDRSPEEIIHHPAWPYSTAPAVSHTYVAFKVKPKQSFRKEIWRCVHFKLSS